MYWKYSPYDSRIIEICPIPLKVGIHGGGNAGIPSTHVKEHERAMELCTALGFPTTPYRGTRPTFGGKYHSFDMNTPTDIIAHAIRQDLNDIKHKNPVISFIFRNHAVQVILYY